MYFATAAYPWEVCFSKSKKKVRHWAKQNGFNRPSFGFVHPSSLSSPEDFQTRFGQCSIIEIDQRARFDSSFVLRQSW
jgi:hypothetical protein